MTSESRSAATTTVPSDPTTDPKTVPQPPQPPRKLPRKLHRFLFRYISHLARTADYNLVRLSKLLSTPASTDALLCTISYTLELVHALLSKLLETRLTAIATDIAEKADGVLLPGETLIATLPAPDSTKILAQIVGSSKALAGVIGDFRIFVRLWGLAGIYSWARGTWHDPLPSGAGTKERMVRNVTWAQIVSCMLFQILENGAYLSSKGALTSASWTGEAGKIRENKWWMWSSRFWAAHVFLELIRLYVLWLYKDYNSEAKEEKQKIEDGEKEGKLLVEEKQRETWLWWRDLASNIAYAPMTLHWSVEEGFLSDAGVGLLGTIAGGALLVDAWRGTA